MIRITGRILAVEVPEVLKRRKVPARNPQFTGEPQYDGVHRFPAMYMLMGEIG